MLVLTRKKGECIRIGDDIVIEVLGVENGRRVRLRVGVPRDTMVYKGEDIEVTPDSAPHTATDAQS